MDYNETLLQSIQLLIDKSLEDFQVDKNEICTIVDDSNKNYGEYDVTINGTVIHKAYCEKTTYKKNDQVIVLFPTDDTKKKQILSKYILPESEAPVTYVSQLDKIVRVSDNFVNNITGSIAANGAEELIKIASIGSAQLKNTAMYNCIYLKADFTCLLGQYDIRSGNYGIYIVGYANMGETSLPTAAARLDSSAMLGNPYNFVAPFTQEILFKYNVSRDFERLDVFLYQDNNFTYFDEITNTIKPLKQEEQKTIYNFTGLDKEITISNLVAYIGYEIDTVADNTVKITTIDPLEYNKDKRAKSLSLFWYNKTEDNKFLGFSDGVFDINARYKRGQISAKNVGEQMTTYTIRDAGYATFSSDLEFEVGDYVYYNLASSIGSSDSNSIIGSVDAAQSVQYWIEWLIDDVNATLNIDMEGNANSYGALCRIDLAKTRVQAKVWCNGESYSSNTIEFVNEDINKNNISHLGIELRLEHIHPGYGTYALYGADGALLDLSQASICRKVKAIWTSRNQDIAEDYWKDAIITWQLPKNATMLQRAYQLTFSKEDDDYYYFESSYSADNLIFGYTIANMYNSNYTNNFIKCSIALPHGRGTVSGEIQYVFSTLGQQGTDYTFSIYPIGKDMPWTHPYQKENTKFGATLIDPNGVEQPVTDLTFKLLYSSAVIDDNHRVGLEPRVLQNNYYNMLQGTCSIPWGGQQLELQTTYPIYYSRWGQYIAQAPIKIVYNSLGTLQAPQKFDALKLLDRNTEEVIKNVVWEINYKSNRTTALSDEKISKQLQWLPQLVVKPKILGQVIQGDQLRFVAYSSVPYSVDGNCSFITNTEQCKVNLIGGEEAKVKQLLFTRTKSAIFEKDQITYGFWHDNQYFAPNTQQKHQCFYYTGQDSSLVQLLDCDLIELVLSGTKATWTSQTWSKIVGNNTYAGTAGVATGYKRDGTKITIELDSGDELTLYGYMLNDKKVYCTVATLSTDNTYLCLDDIEVKQSDIGGNNFISVVLGQVFDNSIRIGDYEIIPTDQIEVNSLEVLDVEYKYEIQYQCKNIQNYQPGDYVYLEKTYATYEITGKYNVESSVNTGLELITTLTVPQVFMNTGVYSVLTAYQYQDGEKVALWMQPLSLEQYRYGSPLLNNWDGSLKVDEDNNYILSAMIGAGKKNSDNTFSGVLMGTVGEKLDDGAMSKLPIGLYGYNHGELAFGLKEDGTAFFGKSGSGQILFDGNGGRISSPDEQGLTIDLDDGLIQSKKFTLNAEKDVDILTKLISVAESQYADRWSATKYVVENDKVKDDDPLDGVNIQIVTSNTSSIQVQKTSGTLATNMRIGAYYNKTFQVEKQKEYNFSAEIQASGSNDPYFVVRYKQSTDPNAKWAYQCIKCNISNAYIYTPFTKVFIFDKDYDTVEFGIIGYPLSTTLSVCFTNVQLEAMVLSSVRVLLNNNDPNKDIIYIGRENNDFIQLTQNGSLKIKATNFEMSTGDWRNGAVRIATEGYLFGAGVDNYVGNPDWNNADDCAKESYLVIRNTGLEIHTKNFRLDPSTGDVKIRGSINVTKGSTIGDWYVGDLGLIYPSTAIEDETGISGADAYFSPTKGIKITDNFTVSAYGNLNATGAIISGAITATSLYISGNATIKGKLMAESGAVIEGVPYRSASGDFKIEDSKIWWGKTYFNKEGSIIELRSSDSTYRGNLYTEQSFARQMILDRSYTYGEDNQYINESFYELHIGPKLDKTNQGKPCYEVYAVARNAKEIPEIKLEGD